MYIDYWKDIYLGLNLLNTMSERSIQLVGKSTYIVSLPKEWVRERGLGQKSKVILTRMSNGTLAIISGASDVKRATLPVNQDPDLAVKLLIAAYLDGYDSVTFTSDKAEIAESVRSALRRAMSRLVGFEILHQTPTELEIELAAEPKMLATESGLTRMSLLVESAVNLGLGSSSEAVSEDLDEVDEDSDKLNFMYIRRLRQSLTNPSPSASINLDPLSIFDILMTFRTLERCVDHSVALSKAWLENRNTIDDDTKEKIGKLAYATVEMLKAAVDAFIKKDVTKCTEISKRRSAMRSGEFAEVRRIQGVDPLLTYHISRIVDYSADIAETVLNEGYGFIR